MEMFDAICLRKSVRKLISLPKKRFAEIEETIKQAIPLYPNINMKIHVIEDGEKIVNIMSSIGKIKAPHFLIATSETSEGYLENVGYILEQIVLKLTTQGIATCWIGGHVKDENLFKVMDIPKEHVPAIMVCIGLPENPEKWQRNSEETIKRKPISEIFMGNLDPNWQWIMEAVRLAPSSGNTQPWRFLRANKEVTHLFMAKPNLLMRKIFQKVNRIDMGIALGHVLVASEHLGKIVEYTRMDLPVRKDQDYILSIIER